MKKIRITAALLALVMLLGLFAGCSKNESGATTTPSGTSSPSVSAESNEEKAASTSKYVYEASYLPLDDEIQYISTTVVSGTTLYFVGEVIDGKQTYTDENGETVEYDNYRSGLFRMDVETGECTELTGFTLPGIEEGWLGSSSINNIQVAPDGTVWIVYNTYTYRYNPPEDMDPETDSMYNYYEEGENSFGILHLDESGAELGQITLEQSEDGWNYISEFLIDSAGNVYVGNWQGIAIYDQNGNKKADVDLGENGSDLSQLSSDQIGLRVYKYDQPNEEDNGNYFQPIDPATGKLTGDAIKIPNDAYSFFPGDDTYDIYYDYNGNLYGYSFEAKTKDKVLDWIECDINSNNVNSYSVLSDGRVVAFENSYDSVTQENTRQLIVLTRMDAASVVNKTILTYACMYLDYNMRDAIVKFNRASNTHRIVVRDYSEYNTDDDYTAGIQKLNTEIMSGKLPDMIAVDTYNVPADKYAAKGYLADLYEIIDADTEMSREDFVPSVLKALESDDGKLYQIPQSFYIESAVALEKVVGEYETWNLASLKDAMTKLQPEATVFEQYYTKGSVLSNCISRNISAFVDWKNGAAHFDSDEFKALLEFANSFPLDYNWDDYDYEVDNSSQTRINSGLQLMSAFSISGFDDFLYTMSGYNGDICFVGYPSEDGTANHTLNVDGCIAITTTCADKTAAWDFIKQFLSEEYQSSYNIWSFPINKAAFDKKLEDAMTEEYEKDENGNIMKDEDGNPVRIPKMTYYTATATAAVEGATGVIVSGGSTEVGEDGAIYIYALSQKQADMILNLIENTTAVYGYDEDIMNIISDETTAYFAGEKSLDDTVNMIQSRVNLYVAEQS